MFMARHKKHLKADPMKTNSQLSTLGIENHSAHRASAGLLSSAKFGARGTILLLTLVNGEAAVATPDFCWQTSRDALASRQAGAPSDYLPAFCKCVKLSGPAAH